MQGHKQKAMRGTEPPPPYPPLESLTQGGEKKYDNKPAEGNLQSGMFFSRRFYFVKLDLFKLHKLLFKIIGDENFCELFATY